MKIKQILGEAFGYGASSVGGSPRNTFQLMRKSLVPVLADAGIEVNSQTIAQYAGLDPKTVDQIIKWGEGKKGPNMDLQNVQVNQSPEDRAKLAASVLKFANTKTKRGNGINKQALMQDLGWPEDYLTGMVNDHIDYLNDKLGMALKGQTVRASVLLRDDVDTKQAKANAQDVDTKKQLIKKAAYELSKSEHGSITADDIARWQGPNGETVGLGKRQIDRYLSDDPELKHELDRFRVRGSRV